MSGGGLCLEMTFVGLPCLNELELWILSDCKFSHHQAGTQDFSLFMTFKMAVVNVLAVCLMREVSAECMCSRSVLNIHSTV